VYRNWLNLFKNSQGLSVAGELEHAASIFRNISLTLKIEIAYFFEMTVVIYQLIQHHIPENWNLEVNFASCTSRFHCSVADIFTLLGCYTV